LSAAIHLFGERGYAGTSVRDISDRLGVTKAALYYHFPSKETILDALIDPFLAEIDRLVEFVRLSPTPPPDMIFERLVGAMAGPGAVLFAFSNDPSVIQRRIGESGKRDVLAQYDEIVRALAGPDATELGVLRARCALGCVKSGVFDSAMSRSPRLSADGCPMPGWVSGRPTATLISEEERRVVVEAALAALGGR
jgi:AcrR family transcriptional regulator